MNENFVYIKSHEKYVKAVMFYADENNNLYCDKALTKAVTKDELKEAFLLGAFVEINKSVPGILLAHTYALSEDGTRSSIYCGGDEFYSAVDIVEDDNAAGVSLTAFEVGDVATYIKFDTSKETELVETLNALFAENPDEDQITFVGYDNGDNNSGMVVAAGNIDGTYALIVPNGDMPVIVYATGEINMGEITGVPGWQNLDENNTYTLNEGLTVSELVSADSVNGIVFGK